MDARAERPVVCVEIDYLIACSTYIIIIIIVVVVFVAQMRIPAEVFDGNLASLRKFRTLPVSSQSRALVDLTRTEVMHCDERKHCSRLADRIEPVLRADGYCNNF